MTKNPEFIKALLPHAIQAIGRQHGHLIRWALAKAAQECGWSPRNALILQANNCLGIKAGAWSQREKCWKLFPGVEHIWIKANTGPEAGQDVPWRVFPDLVACFGELVRMWNDRAPYHPFRESAIITFENAYTGNLKGHAVAVLGKLHDVTELMQSANWADERGRIIS